LTAALSLSGNATYLQDRDDDPRGTSGWYATVQVIARGTTAAPTFLHRFLLPFTLTFAPLARQPPIDLELVATGVEAVGALGGAGFPRAGEGFEEGRPGGTVSRTRHQERDGTRG